MPSREQRRDRRRRDLLRMKERALKSQTFSRIYSIETPEDWKKRTIKSAEHLKNCSCYMCGNPRKYEKSQAKLTIQERRMNALSLIQD